MYIREEPAYPITSVNCFTFEFLIFEQYQELVSYNSLLENYMKPILDIETRDSYTCNCICVTCVTSAIPDNYSEWALKC